MKVSAIDLPGVYLLSPQVHGDARGFFTETFNVRTFAKHLGFALTFVQDCQSLSLKAGTLRGLHVQLAPREQGKLVWVSQGAAHDVIVDVRPHSPTLGRWHGVELSAANGLQLWIPPGFAHGFVTLMDLTVFTYKVTEFWSPSHERCIAWNDPDLAVNWNLPGAPIVSEKDANGMSWCAFLNNESK